MNRRIREKKAKQLYALAADELAKADMLLAASEAVRPVVRGLAGLADRVAQRARTREANARRDAAVALYFTRR